jgi:hypothetical protein
MCPFLNLSLLRMLSNAISGFASLAAPFEVKYAAYPISSQASDIDVQSKSSCQDQFLLDPRGLFRENAQQPEPL